MALSSNDLFKAIGAPLKNAYSWGAVHPNGSVVLRVWKGKDDSVRHNDTGMRRFRLTCDSKWNQTTAQCKERHEHIRLLQEGALGYMLLHTAVDNSVKCGDRKIKDVDSYRIWKIHNLIPIEDELGMDIWALAEPTPLEIPPNYKVAWE